jgi:CMP-N-acetylneuraminic acid synthetase
MTDERPLRILGLVPARGGSKGVPRKNARPIAGKSLVRRAFESGAAAGVLDRIILSTDDPAIAADAAAFGLEVPFLRPPEFARDESPMIDVALHALTTLHQQTGYAPDALLLLQPTSPLRRPEHVRAAVALLGDHDSVISVVPLPDAVPMNVLMKITSEGLLEYMLPDGVRVTRRQDAPPAYKRDGTIYLTRTSVLYKQRNFIGRRCVPLILPAEESLTIDDPAEWAEAERVLSGDR